MSTTAALEATRSLHRESAWMHQSCADTTYRGSYGHSGSVRGGCEVAEGVTYLRDWVCVEGDEGFKGREDCARVFPQTLWGRIAYDHGVVTREIRGCGRGRWCVRRLWVGRAVRRRLQTRCPTHEHRAGLDRVRSPGLPHEEPCGCNLSSTARTRMGPVVIEGGGGEWGKLGKRAGGRTSLPRANRCRTATRKLDRACVNSGGSRTGVTNLS